MSAIPILLMLLPVLEPDGQPGTTRWTIDGGGVVSSTGGGLELHATIAQPDAGLLTGGSLELAGGFWFPLDPGDCNIDGNVDLLDYDDLRNCLAGPADLFATGCGCLNLDHDLDIDLADIALFQHAFRGN
ncbi:MAG: hypothetical protein J5J06_16925 [Phycisphaerae bacterium]|nr:hypothetical protein [Phycisphaerae bacterium]